MEFGSKFVYTYSDSSEEEVVSEEEYDNLYTSCVPEQFQVKSMTPAPEVHGDNAQQGVAEMEAVACRGAVASTSSGASGSSSLFVSPLKKSSGESKSKVHHWMKKQTKSIPTAECKGAGTTSPVVVTASEALHPPLKPRAPATKKWRRADTNVVAIKFDQLTSPCNMHTGDMVICSGCQAMLSHVSKLTKDGEDSIWTCDFCGVANKVELVAEEIPTRPDVTYMVEPAPVTTATGRSGKDESLVVFCVDVSGSMCVSQEVPGTVRLKGNHADRFGSLNTEGENQWLHGQRRDVTYVTRLQGVQAAVDNQLQELLKDHPDRRVALVTFGSEVTVLGDGSGIPLTIAGDKLNNEEEIVKIGQEIPLPNSIGTSRDTLGKKVFELVEEGQTALGPALLVSVVIACQVPGSKVIICTDGMANTGLGNLDIVTAEEFEASAEFYQKVSTAANGKGVSVSILTIAGTECKLVELGRVASQTGGQVNTVDPMKLAKEFGNILADPIIATQVVATFLVHKGLYIRNEVDKSSRSVKEVGNVTKGSEVTFEYGVHRQGQTHSSSEAAEACLAAAPEAGEGAAASKGIPGAVPVEAEELPFQVQITYVDLEGAKAMRVLTQTKPITKKRQQAEMYMNMPMLSSHALRQSSTLALEGSYAPSRMNACMYQRLFYRNVDNTSKLNQFKTYNNQQSVMSNGILLEQRREASSVGKTVYELDDEDEETGKAESMKRSSKVTSFFKKQPKVKAFRRMNCPDSVAHNLYVNAAATRLAVEDEKSTTTGQNICVGAAAPVQAVEEKKEGSVDQHFYTDVAVSDQDANEKKDEATDGAEGKEQDSTNI